MKSQFQSYIPPVFLKLFQAGDLKTANLIQAEIDRLSLKDTGPDRKSNTSLKGNTSSKGIAVISRKGLTGNVLKLENILLEKIILVIL